MYISYIRDRQDLGFMCLKDIEAGNQMMMSHFLIKILYLIKSK